MRLMGYLRRESYLTQFLHMGGRMSSPKVCELSQPLDHPAPNRKVRLVRHIRGVSRGQAVVEAALAFTILVTLFTGVVSVGQYIGYDIGLNNAAGTAALAAATQADLGSSGNPTTGAVNAVNAEQGVSNWVACGSPVAPSCVSVSSATQSTGGSTSVTVEQVTLHGAFTPVFSLLGISLPVTVNATAGS
jgi:Flp pilus assembly protein TadG